MPGEEQETQVGRCAHQHQLELAHRFARAQLVEVVHDQPGSLRQSAYILDQLLQNRPAVQLRRRRQTPYDLRSWVRLAKGVTDGYPKALGVSFLSPHGHPS